MQQRLLASANTTYRALSEQQELYIRTADALRSMGYETSAVLDITDSFTYLLATNAASADKGAAAIDAYTKSIQSGRVESESWQTMLAATPTLVDAIAKVTGKTTEQVPKPPSTSSAASSCWTKTRSVRAMARWACCARSWSA